MESEKTKGKKPNPREHANPLSAVTFWWMLPIFYTGYKRDLEIDDLFETLTEHRSNLMGDKLEKAWIKEKIRAAKANREPSLLRVILWEFGFTIFGFGCIAAFLELGVKMLRPIALGKLVRYFSSSIAERDVIEAYYYAGLIILCSFISVIVYHPYLMGEFHVALKLNIACCSLMYRKALRVSHAAMGETTTGQIINLMSNDISRMNRACHLCHYLWIGPLATILVTAIMYQEIGVFALFGTLYIMCYIPFQKPIALGKLVLYYSTNVEDRNTNEAYMYAGILILCTFISVIVFHPYLMGTFHIAVKLNVACCSLMYRKALRLSKSAMGETTVGQIVNLMSNDISRMNGACLFCHDLWIGPLAAIIVTVIMYQEIGISAVFGTLYIMCYIPFQSWLGKRSSVLRLKTALRTDERLRLMNEIINGIQVIKMYTWEKPFAALVALGRRKEISQIKATSYIRGINLAFILFTTRTAIFVSVLAYVLFGYNISASQVFVVTSCFNTLKHTMTDFFPYAIAQVAEAYVSVLRIQKFLLSDETKLQIEFNEPKKTNGVFEPKMTNKTGIVMKQVTAKWSKQSSENTLTNLTLKVVPGRLVAIIGPVGSGKSSLLHAILRELPINSGNIEVNGVVSYASQEPWLFAGSVRQNILFGEEMDRMRYQQVINCCALKTDLTLLPYGDKTIVGERGVSLSGGQRARINLARAVYKNCDIYLLDDPLSAVDTHVGKQLFDTCINGYLRDKTVILITHQLQYLKEVDQIIILTAGVIEAEGSYNQLKETGLDFAKLLDDQPAEEELVDGKVTVTGRRSSTKSVASIEESNMDEPEEVKEQRSVGHVSGAVYMAYLNAVGNGLIVFVVVLFFVLSQIFASASDYFVSYWVNLEEYRSRHNITTTNDEDFWDFSRDSCIYIYSGLILITIVITIIRSFIFFNACMRSSTKLHDDMFTSITRATMRFFNTNTSGRILNRFSKDMGNIDELLPAAMIDVIQIGLSLIGVIVLITIVNPWLLLPTVVALIIFNLYRIVYLSTSRSIKRLEGITSSPVFGHLAASLQGLTTIRAFKAQHILEKEFDNHQDLHSTAWYMYLACSRTFAIWLDTACVVYMAAVTMSFFVIGSEEYGGNVGLAITQVMGMMGLIQWGIRQASELENQMTSVERVNEYSQIEHEPPLESEPKKKPPPDWPTSGRIEFRNIYLTYVPTDPPVLKNLSFTIKPKEKVGIVGRTGAGKSSLIAALFQLTKTDGQILIDNRDIKQLGLHDLRSKVSIIPQEPVLFSGTMRTNLDPFDEYSDETLWRALEEVELKQAVTDLAGGLNSKMSEGGTNFSVGQRQLVCLARAIVRSNKILVLDEATANVDPQTDALIQQTIRYKFAECTVLTIAHRLHTVMDSDKVLVMDAGTMVEFNHPHLLLQNPSGVLYKMVEKTGAAMQDNLTAVAQESFRKSGHQHVS